MLINTRNKETRLYKQAGATETSAMRSAEGAVQEKKYDATFPILCNVSGVPTYFMTLKDNAKLVKMTAWVSVEDYSVVGIDESVQEALRDYRRKLMSKGNNIAPDSAVERLTATGKVLRIGKEGSSFYLLIEGYENKLFSGSMDLSIELLVTNPGDNVEATYDEGKNGIVDMASFDNTVISLQKSEAQETVEKRAEEVSAQKIEQREQQNTEGAWENLTLQEKRALMEKAKN